MNQPIQPTAVADQQKINTLALNHELLNRDGSDYKISTDISSELRVATLAYLSIQQEFNRIGKTVKIIRNPTLSALNPLLRRWWKVLFATRQLPCGWLGSRVKAVTPTAIRSPARFSVVSWGVS